MKVRTLAIVPVTAVAVAVMSGTASAHPVGTPGTPTCFGERISHANSDHELHAKDRVAGLQDIVDSGLPEAVAYFGEVVTVREMMAFVRANCSDNPIVPS